MNFENFKKEFDEKLSQISEEELLRLFCEKDEPFKIKENDLTNL